jgi:hypothetical protein
VQIPLKKDSVFLYEIHEKNHAKPYVVQILVPGLPLASAEKHFVLNRYTECAYCCKPL